MNEARIEFGEGRWTLWPIFCVRRAGFPYSWLDGVDADTFPEALAEASRKLGAALRREELKEAIVCQNPAAAASILDAQRGTARKRRSRTRSAIGYLARYTAKNDSIGFYGPVGWGAWTEAEEAAGEVRPVPRGDTFFFELWAMRAVAEALVRKHDLWRWTTPVPAPAVRLSGDTLYLHDGTGVRADAGQREILRLCDGTRTVAEVIESLPHRPPQEVAKAVRRMQALGVLTRGYALHQGRRPERRLRRQLRRIRDRAVREAALRDLDAICESAREVQRSHGDADAVAASLARLEDGFRDLTGTPGSRESGKYYAGRAILYEDCASDDRVSLPTGLLNEVGPCIDLILLSARWYSRQVADRYLRRARDIMAESGSDLSRGYPLAELISRMAADFWSGQRSFWNGDPRPVDAPAAELRRKWTRILRPDESASAVTVASARIKDRVLAEFAADGPGWPGARWHSPDLLIAADDAADIGRGRFLAVLGEVHPAVNSTDQLCLAGSYGDPAAYQALADADMAGRIVPLYPPGGDNMNSRTSPPDFHLSQHYRYIGIGTEAPYQPPGAELVPIGPLRVFDQEGTLVVRSAADDFAADLVEVLDAYLSDAACSTFGVLDTAAHQPRVTIDKVVVARETWRVPLADMPDGKDLERLYRNTRALAAELGLPRFVFGRVSGEVKPVHVDLRNPLLIDAFWAKLRRGRAREPDGHVRFTQMLREAGRMWMRDASGRRYSSEVRLICTDRTAYRRAAQPRSTRPPR